MEVKGLAGTFSGVSIARNDRKPCHKYLSPGTSRVKDKRHLFCNVKYGHSAEKRIGGSQLVYVYCIAHVMIRSKRPKRTTSLQFHFSSSQFRWRTPCYTAVPVGSYCNDSRGLSDLPVELIMSNVVSNPPTSLTTRAIQSPPAFRRFQVNSVEIDSRVAVSLLTIHWVSQPYLITTA